jgi:hypothetical protein
VAKRRRRKNIFTVRALSIVKIYYYTGLAFSLRYNLLSKVACTGFGMDTEEDLKRAVEIFL